MAIVTTILAVFGFGLPAVAQGTITRAELKDGMAKGSHVLIDVREPDEFAAGHVPGATNLPLSRFDPKALPQDGRTIVLMCRSGQRSGVAQNQAAQVGIASLNYVGSMLEWTGAGEPVVRSAGGR